MAAWTVSTIYNNMMKTIVFYLILSVLSVPAFAESVYYDFEEVLSRHSKRIKGMIRPPDVRLREKGVLRTDFLKVKGGAHIDNVIKEQFSPYKTDYYGRLLIVKIPIGQYYLDTTEGFFSGETQCSTGMASSGMDIRRLNTDKEDFDGLFVKNSWSCGSMGCSYVLTFGNKKQLLSHCEEKDKTISHGEFLDAFEQQESLGSHQAVGDFGQLGLYQMGKEALVDVRYIQDDGRKNNNYKDYQWTGIDGISSYTDFLNNAQAQTGAINTYHEKILLYYKKNNDTTYSGTIMGYDGIADFINLEIDDVLITEAGLLAAARLVGARAIVSWLSDLTGGVHIYERIYELEEVLSRHAERIKNIRVREQGRLKASFLTRPGDGSIIKDMIFPYQTSVDGYLLVVKIPLGEHYLGNTKYLFSEEAHCSTGRVLERTEIRSLNADREELGHLFVEKSRSCGTRLCSYTLTFGDERLLSNCILKQGGQL